MWLAPHILVWRQFVSIALIATIYVLLYSPNSSQHVLVIDVRDSDFVGGHISGCVNQPAAMFEDNANVDKFLARLPASVRTLVVHCYLSQQRGPFVARR